MIFGMTNVGGGGGQNFLHGTFTGNSSYEQKSFSVSGLTFEPKQIFVRRTATSGSAGLLFNGYTDFENNVGTITYGAGTNGREAVYDHPVFVKSVNGDTYTFETTGVGYYGRFSVSGTAGTYSYYIYG